MKKEITTHDWIIVSALIKWAKRMKKKIEVKKLGNDFAGIYWKVKLK